MATASEWIDLLDRVGCLNVDEIVAPPGYILQLDLPYASYVIRDEQPDRRLPGTDEFFIDGLFLRCEFQGRLVYYSVDSIEKIQLNPA